METFGNAELVGTPEESGAGEPKLLKVAGPIRAPLALALRNLRLFISISMNQTVALELRQQPFDNPGARLHQTNHISKYAKAEMLLEPGYRR